MKEAHIDGNQTVMEHITDLRKAIISSVLFFAACFILFLIFINQVIPLLTEDKLVMLGPLDVIRFYAGLAGSLSLGFSAPCIGYQVCKSVNPALKEQESKTALYYIPDIFLHFMIGIAFS